MREPISSNPASGTTRFQVESPAQSFIELLGVADYERQDVAAPQPTPIAPAPWVPMADRLKDASDLALTMELNRRGSIIASKILSGKYHESGIKKHVRKSKKRGTENGTK